MSFWELLIGVLVVSAISILAAPGMWSSHLSLGELFGRKKKGPKKE